MLTRLVRGLCRECARVHIRVREVRDRYRARGLRGVRIYLGYYLNLIWVSFLSACVDSRRVQCPYCGWHGYAFMPLDGQGFWVPSMHCPRCMAMDRHRAFHYFVHRYDRQLLDAEGVLLHFAPEKEVHRILDGARLTCFAADIDPKKLGEPPGASFRTDICRLPLPDACADYVICFHLLEHLDDDQKGLREINRVLKPGGTAYIMVPIDMRSPKTVYFGYPHPDYFMHFYAPGRDYGTRLTLFDCEEIPPGVYLDARESVRYGIPPSEIIFRCRRKQEV